MSKQLAGGFDYHIKDFEVGDFLDFKIKGSALHLVIAKNKVNMILYDCVKRCFRHYPIDLAWCCNSSKGYGKKWVKAHPRIYKTIISGPSK